MATPPLARSCIVILVLAALVLLWPARPITGPADAVLAKSYSFPRVQIAARVNPDGSMWITEHRTYAFSGSYSWATYTLERRGWSDVTDISVADQAGSYARSSSAAPRTYDVSLTPKGLEIRWNFRAEDEEKTFTFRYRVVGVVIRYRDVAELYWRFIGTDWEVYTERAEVDVVIHGVPAGDLRAWGHGPLAGEVTLHDGGVRLAVTGLDAGEMIEGRILFPPSLVPGARPVDEDALPRVLKEEARRARQANLVRLSPLLNVATFPVSLLGALAVWTVLYLRVGKEHRVRLDAQYLREPPASYSPAMLGALLRWGKPARQDFGASILDLARRGFLTISPIDPGADRVRFTRIDQEATPHSASDGAALALLFAYGAERHTITDAEFRTATRTRTSAGQMFRAWQNAVAQEARGEGFFDRHSERAQAGLGMIYWIFVLLGIGVVVAGIAWLRIPLFAGLVAFPLAGQVILWLRAPLARRSEKGARHLAQWRAFRRFLCDFSMLADAPPPAVELWDIYLPYAVTLGVAERVIRQFPAVYGAPPPSAPSWYGPSRVAMGGWKSYAAASAIPRSLSFSLALSPSTWSSSSGRSSGGFSSGTSGGSRGGGGSGGRAG